jgi:acetyl-CoA acetyltransferase
MKEAVIVDAVCVLIGKFNDALKNIRPDDLASHAIKELLIRNLFDPSLWKMCSLDDRLATMCVGVDQGYNNY